MEKMNEIMNEQEKNAVLSVLNIDEERFVEIYNYYEANNDFLCMPFTEQFGVKEYDGQTVVRNKILLRQKFSRINSRLVGATTMTIFKAFVSSMLNDYSHGEQSQLMSYKFYSENYVVLNGGICMDGDAQSVRYMNRNRDNGIFKMRAGKFMRKIMDEAGMNNLLLESTIVWFCEEFANDWAAFAATATNDKYRLVVDDDFKSIYTNDLCDGDFHSCMSRDEDEYEDDYNCHYKFYENAVKAKAASLRRNEDDMIVARAIIFTEVFDDSGKVWRLCERQYSTGCDERLKNILVNMLIDAGEIDGYKRVGADCHNSRAFIGLNGEDLSGKRFRINCYLDYGDNLSYQDSFKNYDTYAHVATNYGRGCKELDDTSDYFEEQNYDEYHCEYTSDDVINVIYRGDTITCSRELLYDFVWCENYDMYVHEDDAIYCESDDDYHYRDDDVVYCKTNNCYYLEDDDRIVKCYDDDCYYLEDDDDIRYCDDDCEYHFDRYCTYCEELDKYFYDEDEMEDALVKEGYVYCELSGTWENEDDLMIIHTEKGDRKEPEWYIEQHFVRFGEEYYTEAALCEFNNALCEAC